jgi:hypothetical protein
MKAINKRRLFFCIIFSVLINGAFYIRQLYKHRHFEKQGIIKELYVKRLNSSETTFYQKVKFTSVSSIYFITSTGDTIHDIMKNIWAVHVKVLKKIPFYLPLDSVIYDSEAPENFQLISEFRNYSKMYSIISYFLVGPFFFTVWFYAFAVIIEKIIARFRKKVIS